MAPPTGLNVHYPHIHSTNSERPCDWLDCKHIINKKLKSIGIIDKTYVNQTGDYPKPIGHFWGLLVSSFVFVSLTWWQSGTRFWWRTRILLYGAISNVEQQSTLMFGFLRINNWLLLLLLLCDIIINIIIYMQTWNINQRRLVVSV